MCAPRKAAEKEEQAEKKPQRIPTEAEVRTQWSSIARLTQVKKKKEEPVARKEKDSVLKKLKAKIAIDRKRKEDKEKRRNKEN